MIKIPIKYGTNASFGVCRLLAVILTVSCNPVSVLLGPGGGGVSVCVCVSVCGYNSCLFPISLRLFNYKKKKKKKI